MSEVKKYSLHQPELGFAYMLDSHDGDWVLAEAYDQLKALLESSAVAKELIAARAELVGLKAENERLTQQVSLREQALVAADQVTNAEIAVLRKQLDEARELLLRTEQKVLQPLSLDIQFWLERSKGDE